MEDPGCTGPKAMQAAYEASLGPIHPWILRKSMGAAFKMAPARVGSAALSLVWAHAHSEP